MARRRLPSRVMQEAADSRRRLRAIKRCAHAYEERSRAATSLGGHRVGLYCPKCTDFRVEYRDAEGNLE